MPGVLLLSELCFKVETDKCSQSGDEPQGRKVMAGIWARLAGRRMDLGVERHEPHLPADWAVGGSWEDGLDQTVRVCLALLKILHFILLATGCY